VVAVRRPSKRPTLSDATENRILAAVTPNRLPGLSGAAGQDYVIAGLVPCDHGAVE
jgi:hypothetical protein